MSVGKNPESVPGRTGNFPKLYIGVGIREKHMVEVVFDIGQVLAYVDYANFARALGKPDFVLPEDIRQKHDLGMHAEFAEDIRQKTKDPRLPTEKIVHEYAKVITGPNAEMIELKDELLQDVRVGLLSDSHQIVRDYIEKKWPGTLKVNGTTSFSDEHNAVKPHKRLYEPFDDDIIYIDDRQEYLGYPRRLGWMCIQYKEGWPKSMTPNGIYRAGTVKDIREILSQHIYTS